MIYLDYAATTPMSKQAIEAYIEGADRFFGNTNSLHDMGTTANEVFTLCRRQLADLVNGDANGIYFTSGGTEANQLAIRSLLNGSQKTGRHIITSSIEHSSILNLAAQLEEEGYTVTYLPVDQWGTVSLNDLQEAVREDTVLVSIQHVNHEIGTVQPIESIGSYLRNRGIVFHCDCVQSFGKLPIDVKACFIDSLSISSHKIYGPKGVGAVYIDPSASWKTIYKNTTHQDGFRPGTVDIPGIVSFITAARTAHINLNKELEIYKELRQEWLTLMEPYEAYIEIQGHPVKNVSSIIGMSINGIQGQYVMLQCNRHGIAISTGSACQVGSQHPSKTMIAIGKSEEEAKQFIRISLGEKTSSSDLKKLQYVLQEIIHDFHGIS